MGAREAAPFSDDAVYRYPMPSGWHVRSQTLRLGRLLGRMFEVVRTFWGARKLWAPQPAKIAVLDGTGLSILTPLFDGERYEVVPLDGKAIFVSPRILLSALRHAIRMRGLSVTFAMAGYAVAVLERIKPAIVVTSIDNSAVFQLAGQRFRAARFLAIQNGGRLLDRDHPVGRSLPIRLREFACMGQYEIDQFVRHGAIVERYYPIGSLRDAYYREGRQSEDVREKEFDLCLPSQFKPGARLVFSERLDSFDVLARHVRRFCESHGATLCVPLRRHPDTDPAGYDWECRYLGDLLGDCGQVFANVQGAYTTYSLVDRSRVSIGMHSTVLRESFGRGNRVLSCNYTGDPVYTFPLPGPWRLTDPAYEAFEQRLLWLLNASEDDYAERCGGLPGYLISYNEELPTHAFLRRLIADAVRGVPDYPQVMVPDSQRSSGEFE